MINFDIDIYMHIDFLVFQQMNEIYLNYVVFFFYVCQQRNGKSTAKIHLRRCCRVYSHKSMEAETCTFRDRINPSCGISTQSRIHNTQGITLLIARDHTTRTTR